jgi:hypothetical protein
MKSSASTTLRAADNVRAAASSAVVSVSTPYRAPAPCPKSWNSKWSRVLHIHEGWKSNNTSGDFCTRKSGSMMTQWWSILLWEVVRVTYRGVANCNTMSGGSIDINIIVPNSHVAECMAPSLLQGCKEGLTPVLCQLPNNTITPGPNKSKDVFHTQNSLIFSANLHSNVYEMMSFKVRKTETF